MPAYRKGDRWRVVVWRGGVRRDWVIDGSKADAEAFEARQRVELATSGDRAVELRVVPNLSDFCASQYRTHAQTHLKASTWRNRIYQLATLEEKLGHLQLTQITTAELDAYQTARKRAGISPATINDELKVLLAILNFARSLGHQMPALKVKWMKVPKRRRAAKAWSLDQVQRLLRAFVEGGRLKGRAIPPRPYMVPIVTFLLNTGCRKGEALALEWENVDGVGDLVRIWPSEEWQPKDEEPREIPINDALRPWLVTPKRHGRWVFPSEDGDRYAFWPQRAFDEARELAGLRGGPHTMRHTFATHFLATTPDLFLLARILGHSHERVTQLYAHLLPDHLARARGAVAFVAPVSPAELEAAKRWASEKPCPATVPRTTKGSADAG